MDFLQRTVVLKEVEEVLEFYHNSGNFKTILSYIVEVFPTPFDFYRDFGSFLKAKINLKSIQEYKATRFF
jgi:hypothetical protein